MVVGDTLGEPGARPLLTLGRVDRVRVQVGYRARPDGPAHQQFMLDLPVPATDSDVDRDLLDQSRVLIALEPVLYVGGGAPRHYSLHQHRWHTSWGPSLGALDLGLLVTTGSRTTALSGAPLVGVVRAFRALLEAAGRPEPAPTSRDAAILRARQSAATAYALDPETLSLSAEEHHPAENSWTLGLRTTAGDEYDVVVGLVDGFAGSLRIRHVDRVEVFDAVGSE
jgi:hypothetical protein